jgi:hypothetical protein
VRKQAKIQSKDFFKQRKPHNPEETQVSPKKMVLARIFDSEVEPPAQ